MQQACVDDTDDLNDLLWEGDCESKRVSRSSRLDDMESESQTQSGRQRLETQMEMFAPGVTSQISRMESTGNTAIFLAARCHAHTCTRSSIWMPFISVPESPSDKSPSGLRLFSNLGQLLSQLAVFYVVPTDFSLVYHSRKFSGHRLYQVQPAFSCFGLDTVQWLLGGSVGSLKKMPTILALKAGRFVGPFSSGEAFTM
ncbi:Kremen protein 1 [Triplophysa tibetana]|uniref:Kremen protein 1 n=1 Tax=Triplophysa tibetana TaxID=1572043 RepID=A0A5A9P4A9_9TELE|nr:Kremen protein 1 [Triplophysa tibetana]